MLTLATRKIRGACTSNTLGLTGNDIVMSGTCFVTNPPDPEYESSHTMGNFYTVFTNSDPTNCPVTECKMRQICTTDKTLTSVVG